MTPSGPTAPRGSTPGKLKTRKVDAAVLPRVPQQPLRLQLQPSPTVSPDGAHAGPAAGAHHPRERLVKINARMMRHGRYVVFQLAAVAGFRFLPSGGPQGANVGCLKLPTAASWPCNRRHLADVGQMLFPNVPAAKVRRMAAGETQLPPGGMWVQRLWIGGCLGSFG